MNTRQRTFVVGEGITEQYYFKHLNGINSYGITVKPRLFSKNSIYYIANYSKLYKAIEFLEQRKAQQNENH